jgi:hypothetical protein
MRGTSAALLIYVGIASPAIAETSPRSGDLDNLARIFAPRGTPSIQGKTWVAVDTGPANQPFKLQGWLLQEDAKQITLLDWYGEVHRLRKPSAGDMRPSLKDEKVYRILTGDNGEVDYSVAWKIEPEEFATKSKKFLAAGLPKEGNREGVPGAWSMANDRFGLAHHVIEAARHAHFAHQLGQKELAAELYGHAELAYKKYADHYGFGGDKKAKLHEFVAERLASNHRNRAINAGHGATSRKELRKQWEKIASIPFHDFRDEARDMVKHYGSLLMEDAVWKEPDARERAKMTTEQQVSYWLYHLRDLDVGQWSDPGHCFVLGGRFGLFMSEEEKERPNAAVELKKLGMAAIPQLIAHLDDGRPTRCKGHFRSYWPDGHYLLRYGDCCQQIFQAITGKTILTSGGYPMQDGKGKQCKAIAERWWQT